MVWLNCFAGDSAVQAAERTAKENQGYSVDIGNYDGVKPALTVYSSVTDLLQYENRWIDTIDNFLPITWEEYKHKYLIRITFNGYNYWVRAFYLDYIGWILVVEYTEDVNSPESYYSQPEFEELTPEVQNILMEKFNNAIKEENNDSHK